MSRELSAEEQVQEIHDEFMIESAEYKLADVIRRENLLKHINALLDTYLDLWIDYGSSGP